MEIKEVELKPCPFCGGKAELHSWHKPECMAKDEIRAEVWCNDCPATVGTYLTKEEAVEAWNRRAD